MLTNSRMMHNLTRLWLPVVVAMLIGYAAATSERYPTTAQAEVRKTQKRAAFQSGAARSETLLREISGTLKQIDARLQRIERSIAQNKRVPR